MTISNESTREWVTAVARPNTPLFLSFLISGQDRTAIQAHTGLACGFDNIRRSGIRLQYDRGELANAAEVVRAQASKDGLAFYEHYADRCLDTCRILLATVDRIAKEHWSRGHGQDEVEQALAQYFAAAAGLGTFLQTLIVVQFELESTLRKFVIDRLEVSGEDAQNVMAKLQMAIEPTDELRNLIGMLELAVLVQGTAAGSRDWIAADPITALARLAYPHAEVWAGMESYRSRFGWMGRRYYSGDPISAIDIVVRLQNLLRDNCAERLAGMDQRRRSHLEERRQAIERLGDGDAQRLADVLSRYMHLRSYRLDVFFIAHERVVPLFEEVARRLGLASYDDTVHLSWQELTAGLQGRCDGQELASRAAKRRLGFEFVSRAGRTKWIPNQDAETASAPEGPTDPLQGVSAWGGQARGRVRVIASDDDMGLMQPGEILVATMTQPRLMLAVEKAGAIVTDEGGMLCHAAIVSRERDLPCVIGTKWATRVFRTGDLVDVDATAGVIRLSSRQHRTDPKGEPES